MKRDLVITPIFVLGCPRSGTTAAGALLATSARVIDLGEFGGFYLTYSIAHREYLRTPSLVKESYLHFLEEQTAEFAYRQVSERRGTHFVDSTPWNLRVVADLRDRFPSAIFVLTLRHYRGVIQSLGRSYSDGWKWAGETLVDRAQLWSEFYSFTRFLPNDRLAVLNFDLLCRRPKETLLTFGSRMRTLGFSETLDARAYSQSHATVRARPTIVRLGRGGNVVFQPRPSFDPVDWNEEMERLVTPATFGTNSLLKRVYGDLYVSPDF